MCQQALQPAESCPCKAVAPDKVDEHEQAYRPHGRLTELTRKDTGELVATFANAAEPFVDVRVARCLPWSEPDSLISIRDDDGKELVLLETLDDLPEDTRKLVEEELFDKHFSPRVLKVLSLDEKFGFVTIEAETDRGRVQFQIKGRDEVRALSATRCVLKDVDGNMYEIPDVTLLDAESRRSIVEYF